MIVLIVKTRIKPQLNNVEAFSFDEEYNKYLQSCKKRFWATLEGFQLMFPETYYSDLKTSYYLYPKTVEDSTHINKYYKVIATYNLLF